MFEWQDGPLIQAMIDGSFFLADEISLADHSVLERLNSVLEPERKLFLTEKSFDNHADSGIQALTSFQFFATMNPGGDYGKKEVIAFVLYQFSIGLISFFLCNVWLFFYNKTLKNQNVYRT